jgi:hypothetical protein
MMLMSIVTAMPPSNASVDAALRLLGTLKAGTPLLIASTPVSAAQPELKARSSRTRQALGVERARRADLQPGALHLWQVAEDRPHEPERGHPDDGGHEEVGRDGEEGAGLPHPAQVHRHEDDDHHDGERRLVAAQLRDRRGGVLRPRGHRDGDGEHVVDEQRAGDGQPELRAEVGGGDLVVTTA